MPDYVCLGWLDILAFVICVSIFWCSWLLSQFLSSFICLFSFLSWLPLLDGETALPGRVFRVVCYPGNLKALTSFFNAFDLNSNCSNFPLTLSNLTWKMCLWAFIALLYVCQIIYSLRAISCMTFSFHSLIFSFSAWRFWVVNCLIATSADFFALMSICDFSRYVTLLLVALRTPVFSSWFSSNSTPI